MSLSCWILTDGRTGTENNARGLVEALSLSYEVKAIHLRQPWKTLSPWLRVGLRHAFSGDALVAPWPDLLITAGRTPAVGSLYIGQQNPGTVRVHITSPGVSPSLFDLVIAPAHDGLKGNNVITTHGALHRVTTEKLEAAKKIWEPRFAHLPRPWHGVLVGGDAHGLRLDAATAHGFMDKLKNLDGSTLVTASRRTGPEARAELAKHASYLWDGAGDNPYLGLLACCDALFVTSDSVSMISEAASSGKPTYLLELTGHAPKLARFHQVMLENGHLARFTGTLTAIPTTRLDDMAKVTAAVQQLLVARGKLCL